MKGGGSDVPTARLDRRAISCGSLAEQGVDVAYWKASPLHKRLEAIEINRHIAFGDHVSTARLQRVLETAELRTR
jgi:hypothetical protein